jgi:hypothetical protein
MPNFAIYVANQWHASFQRRKLGLMRAAPGYADRFTARLATDGPSPYLLLAETLGGIQTQLPPGLIRSERQPVDPPEVVEIWFAG